MNATYATNSPVSTELYELDILHPGDGVVVCSGGGQRAGQPGRAGQLVPVLLIPIHANRYTLILHKSRVKATS